MRTDLKGIHITLKWGYAGNGKQGWWATMRWQDTRFCEAGAVEGEICTRYGEETPAAAIDAVLEVAETFGLALAPDVDKAKALDPPGVAFALYYHGDGEDTDPRWEPPAGWRQILADEAERRGWETYRADVPLGVRPALES